MKITNYKNSGGNDLYEIMDPCPVCCRDVTKFVFEYKTVPVDVFRGDYPKPVGIYYKGPEPTFTFQPCGHTVSDKDVVDWHVVRCTTKQQYNAEVVKRAYRIYTAKSRTFAKAYGASDVRLRANCAFPA